MPEGSNKPAYIYADTYVGIAIGITNNHLNISLPGKLKVVTSHAQETPITNVKIATNINIMKVLDRYSKSKFSLRCVHSSDDGWKIYDITVTIGMITNKIIKKTIIVFL